MRAPRSWCARRPRFSSTGAVLQFLNISASNGHDNMQLLRMNHVTSSEGAQPQTSPKWHAEETYPTSRHSRIAAHVKIWSKCALIAALFLEAITHEHDTILRVVEHNLKSRSPSAKRSHVSVTCRLISCRTCFSSGFKLTRQTSFSISVTSTSLATF